MRGKGILGATAAALAIISAPALAGDLGTAGTMTYALVEGPLEPNEEVQVQTDCAAGANMTAVGFGADFGGVRPLSLFLHSASAAEATLSATASTTFSVYPMCTTASVKYVEKSRSVPATAAATIKAKCPVQRHVAGGGVDAYAKVIQNSYPYDSRDKDSKPDDGWKASAQGADEAEMTVVAACVKAMPSYRSKKVDLSPGAGISFPIKCKTQKHLSATGARMTGATGFGGLEGLRPLDGSDADTAPDDSGLVNMDNYPSNPDSEKLTATAVCVE